jgi:hypothetical protein
MIEKLIGPVTGLLDKFIEDKDQKNALAHEIATMSQKYAQEIAQVLGMFGNFITIPFSNFVMALLELDIVIPLVPLETMMPVLMGMLGLGAMRTYEKKSGVSK